MGFFRRLMVNACVLSSLCLSLAGDILHEAHRSTSCKNIPGDKNWPSSKVWAELNSTVHGQLIAAVLPAQVCHGDSYDAAKCVTVQENWGWAGMHWKDPTSIMNPYWLNDTCSPYTARDAPCTLGNIVSFAINVTSAEDVAAGVKFAQEQNIRLVIKNTGHDFLGRSTGKGALSLWMHNLKDISFTEYKSKSYTGSVVELSAGVMAYEAYQAADVKGYRVVGGSCPTVGLVGGYTQGAGHGPLTGEYGLAADNAIKWEVITADGRYLVASQEENQDLYWALAGGGGGTYGVVLSLTTKAHKDGPIGGGTMLFNSSGVSADNYWEAVGFFNQELPKLIENEGLELVYFLSNTSFWLNFITWPSHTAAEVEAAVNPFARHLMAANITYSKEFTSKSSFYKHYAHYTPALPYGNYPMNELLGGRNIPYSTVQNNNSALTAALRNITTHNPDWALSGVTSKLSYERTNTTPQTNSVPSFWRDTLVFLNIVGPWDERKPAVEGVQTEHKMTHDIVPQLDRISPGSGAYINEADVNNPNWKNDFFGANYNELLKIKKKYDPNDLFYAGASVGHDVWDVASDGRLCRASQRRESEWEL
ncbi:MAG: hypothetical protein Q9187_000768 [Circinaria calcarea]